MAIPGSLRHMIKSGWCRAIPRSSASFRFGPNSYTHLTKFNTGAIIKTEQVKIKVLQSSKQELRNKRIYFWENNDNKKASLLFMI